MWVERATDIQPDPQQAHAIHCRGVCKNTLSKHTVTFLTVTRVFIVQYFGKIASRLSGNSLVSVMLFFSTAVDTIVMSLWEGPPHLLRGVAVGVSMPQTTSSLCKDESLPSLLVGGCRRQLTTIACTFSRSMSDAPPMHSELAICLL